MAFSCDYISGLLNVGRTFTIWILNRPILAGAWYYSHILNSLLMVWRILNSNSSRDTVVSTVLPFLAVTS